MLQSFHYSFFFIIWTFFYLLISYVFFLGWYNRTFNYNEVVSVMQLLIFYLFILIAVAYHATTGQLLKDSYFLIAPFFLFCATSLNKIFMLF